MGPLLKIPEESSSSSLDSSSSSTTTTTVCEPILMDDAKDFFADLQKLRNDGTSSRRRHHHQEQEGGILIVRCQDESLQEEAWQRLATASRSRRAQRLSNKRDGDSGEVTTVDDDDDDDNDDDLVVRFSDITIREFPIILGDNPGSSSGPALSISWTHVDETVVNVEEYEKTRPTRRDRLEMTIPAGIRIDMLKRAGYSRGEISQKTRGVNIIRMQRARTRLQSQNFEQVNELWEKISHKARNVATLGARKRNERKFLEPYMMIVKKNTAVGGGDERSESFTATSLESASDEFSH